MKKYFSYCDDRGFELHDSIESARLAAESSLNAYEEVAAEDREWPDEADSVSYGELIGRSCSKEVNGAHEYIIESIK